MGKDIVNFNEMKANSAPPFSDFAVGFLSHTHWHDVLPVPAAVLREAADAYLFRFDKALSPSFVRHRLHTAASALAACTGLQPGPALRWLRRALAQAADVYFESRWKHVADMVSANSPALERLRGRFVRLTELISPETHVVSLAPQAVDPLVSAGRPVVLVVYAKYCSKCERMSPFFAEAARQVGEAAFFAAVDAMEHPEARKLFGVDVYPTVMLLQTGRESVYFPADSEHSVDNLVAFARGTHVPRREMKSPVIAKHVPDGGRASLGQWAAMLERQGIDELDALVRDRDIRVHMRIDKAIQCGEEQCTVLPPRSADVVPPVCVLLGGGMGAGKTTAVSAVAQTAFWRAHGQNIVVVEADAFKREDPFFHALGTITPTAARVVHPASISAAETLFLAAVNQRRDVVFDGTLSWAEYARQTVAMLRDGEFEYRRGPGYSVAEDGTVREVYWERERRRPTPVAPYRVELVAVTVDAATAVARGIVRHILEGRGVPVADQLKSHALFSSHFEAYVKLVDSVYLFDMTTPPEDANRGSDHSDDDMSASGKIIAMRPGILFSSDGSEVEVDRLPEKTPFQVEDEAAYSRFLRKKLINTQAESGSELYLSPVERGFIN